MIGPSQKPLPENTQHSQETDIHDTGGNRIRNSGKQAAADPRFRPRGNSDRHPELFQYLNQEGYNVVDA
jgi:hypothetical protein